MTSLFLLLNQKKVQMIKYDKVVDKSSLNWNKLASQLKLTSLREMPKTFDKTITTLKQVAA